MRRARAEVSGAFCEPLLLVTDCRPPNTEGAKAKCSDKRSCCQTQNGFKKRTVILFLSGSLWPQPRWTCGPLGVAPCTPADARPQWCTLPWRIPQSARASHRKGCYPPWLTEHWVSAEQLPLSGAETLCAHHFTRRMWKKTGSSALLSGTAFPVQQETPGKPFNTEQEQSVRKRFLGESALPLRQLQPQGPVTMTSHHPIASPRQE